MVVLVYIVAILDNCMHIRLRNTASPQCHHIIYLGWRALFLGGYRLLSIPHYINVRSIPWCVIETNRAKNEVVHALQLMKIDEIECGVQQ